MVCQSSLYDQVADRVFPDAAGADEALHYQSLLAGVGVELDYPQISGTILGRPNS